MDCKRKAGCRRQNCWSVARRNEILAGAGLFASLKFRVAQPGGPHQARFSLDGVKVSPGVSSPGWIHLGESKLLESRMAKKINLY